MDAATILIRLRRSLLISRAELARLAQLSPSTVGRIEKGTLDPTWGTLSRILESAGFQIRGEQIVPSGDISALVAARMVLDHERATTAPDSLGTRIFEAVVEGVEPAAPRGSTGPGTVCDHDPGRGYGSACDHDSGREHESACEHGSACEYSSVCAHGSALSIETVEVWLRRWHRLGWIGGVPDLVGLVWMSRGAGAIAALEHRDTPRVTIGDKGSWREVARRIGALDIDYAVSGLFTPGYVPLAGTAPTIYVRDPPAVARSLESGEAARVGPTGIARVGGGLEGRVRSEDDSRTVSNEASPGDGVCLVAAEGLELTDVMTVDGIRFTSLTQTLLNAFAGPIEESGPAEVAMHYLLMGVT